MTTYNLPRQLIFGNGTRSQLPELLDRLHNAPRALLVASRSALASEPGQELRAALGTRLADTDTSIRHDPTVTSVDALRHHLADSHATIVVALGGGSVIDAAKTAAFLADQPANTADFLNGHATMPAHGTLPCVAIPTTAGTGAESTRNAVLSDHDANVKKSLRHLDMLPIAAICDPDFTLNCPPDVTAASGMDALTQAIESYCSRNASNLTRPIAAQAAAMLLDALPHAVRKPDDRDSRNAVAEASMLTGLAFAQSGLGSVHGLAHPIGHLLNLPHGLVCAILLPHCLQLNLELACATNQLQTLQLVQKLADACNAGTPQGLVDRIAMLNRVVGIPNSFAQLGLTPAHDSYILRNCRSGSMATNPVELPDDTIQQLLNTLR